MAHIGIDIRTIDKPRRIAGEEHAGGRELLHQVVDGVDHIDVARRVDGYGLGGVERSAAGAQTAPPLAFNAPQLVLLALDTGFRDDTFPTGDLA